MPETPSADSVLLDELVERIRAATFEAPQARSHSEWKQRIAAMFDEFCAFCGVGREDHGGLTHEIEDDSYTPVLVFRSASNDGSGAVDA